MNETAIADRDAYMRRAAADCLEEHQVAGLNLVQINLLSLVELGPNFPGQRRAVAGEYPLHETAAIET